MVEVISALSAIADQLLQNKLLEKPTVYQFLLHNRIIPAECKFCKVDQHTQRTY